MPPRSIHCVFMMTAPAVCRRGPHQGTKASSTRRQPTWSAPRRPTSYSSHARQALAESRCGMHGPSPASPCRDLGAKEAWGQEEKRMSLHACAAASRPNLAQTINGRKTSHTSHTAQEGNHATPITEIPPQIAIQNSTSMTKRCAEHFSSKSHSTIANRTKY